MKGFVLTVLAIGAAVALLAPKGPPPGGPGARAQLAAATVSSKGDKPAWYGGAMVLSREGDGHFYADVKVDTRSYRMLVDTGASMVALTGDDARNMGLDWDPNRLIPVARGAGGMVTGVPVTIPQIAVGDFEAHDVQAVIIPEGLAVSLLGQSFLRHVAKVDIAGDTLTLSD